MALVCVSALLAGCGAASYSQAAPYPAASPERGYAEQGVETVALTADEGGWGGDYWFESADVSGTLSEATPPGANAAPPVQTAQAEPPPADTTGEPAATTDKAATPRSTRRIVIYSAGMTIFVLELDVAMQKAITWADELEGWVQSSTSTSVTMRVPADRFKQLLAWARELGEVRDENIVGQDVTEEYLDLEIRLRNAMELRARYVELLAKAVEVKEILAIEAELGRITEEIERLKGRLRFLTENAQFSTVTLQFVQAPEQYSRSRHVELPFAWLRGYNLRSMYSYY